VEIAVFATPVLLAVLGAVIRFKKAAFLIAGYNTSSKAQKEKYDKDALCKFVGNLLFVLSAILFVMMALIYFGLDRFGLVFGAGFTLFVLTVICAVIYMNTGNRFKKQ
jgi:small-conductance mechanosensitive channel